MWTFLTSGQQFSNTFRNYFTKAGNYFSVLYKMCKMVFNADSVLFFLIAMILLRAAGPQVEPIYVKLNL